MSFDSPSRRFTCRRDNHHVTPRGYHKRGLPFCGRSENRLLTGDSAIFPGWWWSVTTRGHVLYESWLERHHVIEADRDARVTGITGQPFALSWPSGKRQVMHIPDLFCRVFYGRSVVTDCRTFSKIGAD